VIFRVRFVDTSAHGRHDQVLELAAHARAVETVVEPSHLVRDLQRLAKSLAVVLLFELVYLAFEPSHDGELGGGA
jgi:hypothetical protein